MVQLIPVSFAVPYFNDTVIRVAIVAWLAFATFGYSPLPEYRSVGHPALPNQPAGPLLLDSTWVLAPSHLSHQFGASLSVLGISDIIQLKLPR